MLDKIKILIARNVIKVLKDIFKIKDKCFWQGLLPQAEVDGTKRNALQYYKLLHFLFVDNGKPYPFKASGCLLHNSKTETCKQLIRTNEDFFLNILRKRLGKFKN